MHEYSVASELIASLLPVVAEQDGAVRGVFLKKGELRILSDRALVNAFDVLKSGTPLAKASLRIEGVSAHVVCDACGYEGIPEHFADDAMHFSVPILSCPRCNAEVRVTQGRELFVDRLAVDADAHGRNAACAEPPPHA